MVTAPQAATVPPESPILSLGDAFYDRVTAADFPETKLRFRNDRWHKAIGLDSLDEAQWIAHFGRFVPLPGALPEPLALRYHGHQFRSYNPDIGDGRGFLFAQQRDGAGRLLDLATKGSGRTPWSRFGDRPADAEGRRTRGVGDRDAGGLGVETSKSFSLIETGEALHRGDEPSPTRSAVLVRLGHGHIRIGTFQRLAYLDDAKAWRVCRLLPDIPLRRAPGADPVAQLMALIVPRAARLRRATWRPLRPCVLNSDNIAITLESFDYGPWRFAPTWDPDFTAAIRSPGAVRVRRQAQAIHWDVVQLALALRKLVDAEALVPALETFPAVYEAAFRDAIFARLGIAPQSDEADLALIGAMETALTSGLTTIDRFFFDWRGGRLRDRNTRRYDDDAFAPFVMGVGGFAATAATDHPYWSDPEPCSMLIDEVEAIWRRSPRPTTGACSMPR